MRNLTFNKHPNDFESKSPWSRLNQAFCQEQRLLSQGVLVSNLDSDIYELQDSENVSLSFSKPQRPRLSSGNDEDSLVCLKNCSAHGKVFVDMNCFVLTD